MDCSMAKLVKNVATFHAREWREPQQPAWEFLDGAARVPMEIIWIFHVPWKDAFSWLVHAGLDGEEQACHPDGEKTVHEMHGEQVKRKNQPDTELAPRSEHGEEIQDFLKKNDMQWIPIKCRAKIKIFHRHCRNEREPHAESHHEHVFFRWNDAIRQWSHF